MITEPNLNAQERAKQFASLRLQALTWLVLGIVSMLVGIVALALGRRNIVDFVMPAFGLAWLGFAFLMWTRARKFA